MDAPTIAPLADAFPRIAALIEGEGDPGPVILTLADRLAECIGLDDFSRDVLLLAAWAELEPAAAEAIGRHHGNPLATEPTIALALAHLPGAHWSAFAPEAPLRARSLIDVGPADRATHRTISLPESVLFHILGAPTLSEGLTLLSTRVAADVASTPARERLCLELTATLGGRLDTVIQLCGSDPAGKECAAALAAASLDRPLFVMSGSVLPSNPQEIAGLARLWTRDLALLDGVLLLDLDSGGESKTVSAFAEAMRGPLIVSASDSIGLTRRAAVRFDMGRLVSAELAPLWLEALGPMAAKLNGSVPRLAAHFPIAPELMETVTTELEAAPQGADLDAIAWAACRRRARPKMDDLAQRVESRAGWDDIILPEIQERSLRAIAAQVRHRALVYETWGFDATAGGRGLGVSALFSGPSGAGKTLAAEVLGTALDLDVYRIDLSSIVSKWIGETEKNLRRVFDAADEGSAILLFDEADALFGKRSEVKDSHDRYANIEVSYLLQRLEAYRGLAILTTNLRTNIDEAFLRRLRFVVDFPFPAPTERARIWANAFPDDCPTLGLDIDKLAQLNVVGGSIRNIAMNAAFFAAEGDHPVRMTDVLAAARLDYEKANRSMSDSELRGWHG